MLKMFQENQQERHWNFCCRPCIWYSRYQTAFQAKMLETLHKLYCSRFTCKRMCIKNSYNYSGEC